MPSSPPFAAAEVSGRLAGHGVGSKIRPSILLAGGGFVAAAGSVATAWAPSVGLGFAALAVAGFGISICAPTIFGLAGRVRTGMGQAATVSSVTTLSYLGFVLGPALVGLLAESTSLTVAMSVVGALALLMALLASGRASAPEIKGATHAS